MNGELLEVWDDAGHPTGVAKTRDAIHRDGDLHLALFCWIVRSDGTVLVQRRARDKDTFPGLLDASAAGHVRCGEGVAGALREIEEELGVAPPRLEDLIHVGRFLEEHVHPNGIVDRELQEVYVWRCDRPLDDYRPGPEVEEIIALSWAELAARTDVVPHAHMALVARRFCP